MTDAELFIRIGCLQKKAKDKLRLIQELSNEVVFLMNERDALLRQNNYLKFEEEKKD